MLLKKVLQGSVAIGLLTVGMVATANASPSCPGADDVKGAVRALDAVVRQSPQSYFVLTAQPAISGKEVDWMLLTQASGKGFDAAFADGENNIRSVISPVSPEAMEMQGMYVCPYFTSSGGMNVMAVAPQQGVEINVAKLVNLKPQR